MKINILDLIDFEKVDTLLEGFNKTTGFVTAILDLNGKVLSKSGWRQICTEFHRINPETLKKCTISDTELAGKLAKGEKYHFYKCLNGLVDVAVPIVIRGEHIANLFSGQFFFEEPDRMFFKNQAGKYGFNEKNYLEALGKVPVVSKEKVQVAVDFLQNMTQLISEMTFQKLEQTELNRTIKESEEKFRSITEQTSDFISITDARGIITYASPASVKLFQFDPEEMCGRNFIEFVDEPEIPRALEVFRDALNGSAGTRSIEFSLKRKDGSTFFAELNGMQFQQDLMNRTLFVIRDITERKLAEKDLKESQFFFEQLFIQSSTSTQLLDSEGWCVKINPKLSELFSVKPEDIEGKKYNILQDGEIISTGVINHLKRVFEQKEIVRWVVNFDIQHASETTGVQVSKPAIKWFQNLAYPIINAEGKLIYVIVQHEDITEHKLAESKLKESEEKYRTIFENVQDVFYQTNLDGIIIEISPSIKYFSEFTRNEIVGTPVANLYYNPADRNTLLNAIMVNGELRDYELKLKTKTGEVKFVSINARLISDTDNRPNHIDGAIRDITDRKRAEEEMMKFKLCIQSSFEAIFITDINGIINYTNQAFELIYGYNQLEAIGKTPRILKSGILPETIYKQFWDKLLSKEYVTGEIVNKTKDGRLITIEGFNSSILDSNENIIGFVGIHRDITERKKGEEQLRKLSRAVEQSPVSIILTDKEGNIDYANPKTLEITGYELVEIIGKNPRIFSSGETSKSDYKDLWDIISSGKEWRGELQNKKKNGELYWEQASISPIINEKGEITHYLAVKEDITERKQIVEDLIIAKSKAEESDNLKTSFLHNISHEIRTPLNAIVGFSAILTDPFLPSDKRQHFSDIIVQSSNQLLSIITDIINISTIQAGQEKLNLKNININSKCKLIYEQFAPKAKNRNISFRCDTTLSDSEAITMSDETKLLQVLTNLLDNAFKFTNQGHVYYGYNLEDNYLVFYVEDTGIGIHSDLHQEIFKRFRQVEITATRQYGGSGLGLSISKAYVELLGGKMWLISELNKGSTFYFTIPIKKAEKNTLSEKQSNNGKKTEIKGHKILLVAEDEDSNFMLLEELISGYNFNIIRAINGFEAVEICKTNKQIDLILMDIKMPVMDGYEATRQIKQISPDLPIIAQTAYSTDIDKNKALDCGCSDFISKPFKIELLLSKIREQFRE